jgi:hypothetical protein
MPIKAGTMLIDCNKTDVKQAELSSLVNERIKIQSVICKHISKRFMDDKL